MKKHSTIVSVEAVTWSRESNGLFDYESQHISKRSLKAASSAKIIRIKNDIRLVTDVYNERNVCENSKTLALLKHRDGVFTVTRTNTNVNNAKSSGGVDNLWMVVKNMKKHNNNQEYTIKENDVLKLGRIKFRVKELNIDDEIYESPKESEKSESNSEEIESNAESNFEDEIPKPHLIKKINENPELSCRICLNSENLEKNPLISPCGCAGSVKHIHLDCLKHWIKSKTQIKSSGLCVSYTWKSLECELCHQPLPDYFLHNGKRIDLIDLPKPNSSYIILETMAKEKQSGKTFYVVLATENDTIKLGRGNDCDVKINDISASRCHAFIHYSNGKFTLKDNDSKFGTLVFIKNDFVIKPDCAMAVQIGRSVISFSLITKNNSPTQETPDLLKAYSAYSLNNEVAENNDDLEKIQSFFLKNKDLNFQNFIDTVEGVQLSMPSSTSYLSKKDKAASSLNRDLFNLTFAKDKDGYGHVQELLDRKKYKGQSKIQTTSSRAKSTDKVRERKNILNEMKHLNIDNDNDNDEDEILNENNEESDVDFENLRQKIFLKSFCNPK